MNVKRAIIIASLLLCGCQQESTLESRYVATPKEIADRDICLKQWVCWGINNSFFHSDEEIAQQIGGRCDSSFQRRYEDMIHDKTLLKDPKEFALYFNMATADASREDAEVLALVKAMRPQCESLPEETKKRQDTAVKPLL